MMWGRNGGRSLITGNSLGAWLLRVLIFAFLVFGVIAMIAASREGRAQAQPPEGWRDAPEGNPIPPAGGALIMQEATPGPVEAGWQGEKTCEVVQETDRLRAFICSFEPGQGHERHRHPAHFGYILEGGVMRIADEAGTREQETISGASWVSEGVAWHEAVNIGETTTRYLIVEPKAVE